MIEFVYARLKNVSEKCFVGAIKTCCVKKHKTMDWLIKSTIFHIIRR